MLYKNITFIGAGNMTSAIIRGLIADGYPSDKIMATNPSQAKLDILIADCDICTSNSNDDGIAFGDVIILAVKPQLMSKVCAAFKSKERLSNKCFVSIAAGIPIDRLSEMLNGVKNIVRVMPNTPSAIGQGMSGVYAHDVVAQENVQFVLDIMRKVGDTVLVDNEDHINTVIAAAGSSPAYFFLIAEAMQAEAINMGLNKAQARKLVQQAMFGSAKMLKENEDLEPSQLRANVTSKGGTTHQAVLSLQNDNIEQTFARAMQAAVARANEMSKEF